MGCLHEYIERVDRVGRLFLFYCLFNFMGDAMNERIKELAEQAGVTFHSALGATYTYGTLPDLLEKFAELVRADEREQEPVAWIYDWYEYKSQSETRVLVEDWVATVYTEVSDPTIGAHNIRALYTAPPKRQWVGLTDDEIKEVLGLNKTSWSLSGVALQQVMNDVRALEAKLKEKNGE